MPLSCLKRRSKPLILLILSLVIHSVFYFVQAQSLSAVTNVDYWQLLREAESLSLSRPETWVHPFHPVGYLTLLRGGLALGLDVARYGQFLSWLGSLGCLVAVYILLHRLTKKASPALAATILLGLHPFFRFQSLQEGTDMLAAGLQMLAIAAVLFERDMSRRYRLLATAGAGGLLGAAYLVRYTSLAIVPVILLYLWLTERRDGRATIASFVSFMAAFGLIALPQLVASAAVTGNPFYNEMARNVWFGLYGAFNWTENWQHIPQGITLAQIVRSDPTGFLNHWLVEFGRLLTYAPPTDAADPLALERNITLWQPLVNHLAWMASCLLLPFDRRLTRPQAALLLGSFFFPVVAASMAWLFTRFLLVPMALQVIFIVLAAGQVGARLAKVETDALRIAFLLLTIFGVLFLFSTEWDLKRERTQHAVQRVRELQPILAAAGVRHTAELLTNNRLIQVLDDARHPQYPVMSSPGDDAKSVPEFLSGIMGLQQPRYLLFDWTSDAIRTLEVKQYRDALAQAKDQLAPLHLTEEYALYCIMPCGVDEMIAFDETVAPNVTIVGVRTFGSHNHVYGFYLYWQANAPVNHSEPVSLTLRHGGSDALFQSFGHLQQGTYPINRWPVGQTVVDFHLINSAQVVAGRDYLLTVRLEDEQALGQQPRSDEVTMTVRFSTP